LGDEYIQKQHFNSADFVPMKVDDRNHRKYRYLATTWNPLNSKISNSNGQYQVRVVSQISITYLKLTYLCDFGRLWEMKKMNRTLAILAMSPLISTPTLAEDLEKMIR